MEGQAILPGIVDNGITGIREIMEIGIEKGMIVKLNATSAVVKDISHVTVSYRKDLTMGKMEEIIVQEMEIGITQEGIMEIMETMAETMVEAKVTNV